MNTKPAADNVLDLADQMVFLAEQATGATNLIQSVWIYERALDMSGLRRFHQHLQRGRLCRRVERSALPFGRHRWVSAGDASDIEICAPRPRAEFESWLDEQANTPLDCERGPGWHLAVLPFTDGGIGLSLVNSHCLADGVGLCLALAEAVSGRDNGVDWPTAASRPWWLALRQDARQTARDIPAVGRALRAGVAMARRGRAASGGQRQAPNQPAVTDDRITVPTAAAFLDIGEWDTRAEALGGSSNALLAGLAADIAHRVGRVDAADGTVALALPVTERTSDDTRANAVTNVDVVVDPVSAATDLRPIRTAIKQALIRSNDIPDERWALLPLTPLLPERLVRRMVSVAAGGGASVVSSNLGDIDPAVNRPDGTDADYFTMRSLYPGVSRATMHRAGGVVAFLSGRIHGRVFISVLAYLPGRHNSTELLRQTVADALTAFSLSAR
jgi:diacylglycerol O-acyltransferase